jgi:hypothetical protein
MAKYTLSQKQNILLFLKTHTQAETCRTFNIRPDTLKYWQDPLYKQKVQERECSKYSSNNTKRRYTKGNAEKQRISAQITRASKRIPKVVCNSYSIKKEFDRLYLKEGALDSVSMSSDIILTYQQHFYDEERRQFSDTKIAKKLIKNRAKYLFKEPKDITDRELLRGFKISGLHHGYSHFSPQWFKWFIENHSGKSILDPCGGWGHRMLGTIGTKLEQYIYNDFDVRTYSGCKNILNDWSSRFKTKISLFNCRAELLDVSNLEYDTIFTCPPYFNKEMYNNKSFINYEDFRIWWENCINNILKISVNTVGIVIDPINKETISSPIQQSGLELTEQHTIKTNKSHFASSEPKETLLIFKRLDRQKV